MKLTTLGIDSRDFDLKRMADLRLRIRIVSAYLNNPSTTYGRDKVCEAASILDNLVTRNVPLTQYRGLTFADLDVADALLGEKAVTKYPCESWTSDLSIAEIHFKGSSSRIRYLMKRTFSKQEVILDNEGLALVLKPLTKELEAAEESREIHPSIQRGLESLIDVVKEYVRFVSFLGESEFLVHPRPYTPRDILKMEIDEGYDIDERTPNLLRLLGSHPKYTFDELIGKRLLMKAGQIVKVG